MADIAERGWKRPFDNAIPLPRGRQLVTLRDAGNIKSFKYAVFALLVSCLPASAFVVTASPSGVQDLNDDVTVFLTLSSTIDPNHTVPIFNTGSTLTFSSGDGQQFIINLTGDIISNLTFARGFHYSSPGSFVATYD